MTGEKNLKSYKVAIVGRVNVGKSTLFNRLIGGRRAITQEEPGVTRDRLYGEMDWRRCQLVFIDTGGVQQDLTTSINRGVREQTRLAIQEADLIVFVVDEQEGLTGEDEDVAALIRSSKKKVILVANKAESSKTAYFYDFFKMGFPSPLQISALHGTGVGDLLDQIVESLTDKDSTDITKEEIDILDSDENAEDIAEGEDVLVENMPHEIRVAIVGRPNVGKSSLVNAILGMERVLVDDVPGTTRDAIDTNFVYEGMTFVLVDTAGLRRKARVKDSVEYYSNVRAIDAIEKAHIAVLLLDGFEIVQQDKLIARAIQDAGRASVIVINKSDLIPRNKKGALNAIAKREISDRAHGELELMRYAPICFTSAVKKEGIPELFFTFRQVFDEFYKRIETPLLNKVVREFVLHRPPSPHNKGVLKIFYVTQVKNAPPTVVFFVNDPEYLSISYRRYLVNRLRETFGFIGAPVHLIFRKRSKVELSA